MSQFLINEARSSERRHEATRLLVFERDSPHTFRHAQKGRLVNWFREGDRLVVNDVATLPASFVGSAKNGGRIELRLAAMMYNTLANEPIPDKWRCVLFGAGDWRAKTELRPVPPPISEGDELQLGHGLKARVIRVAREISPRVLEVEFTAPGYLWGALWQAGRPIQYSYLEKPLADWDQQTLFSTQPLAVEPPSASFALTWNIIFQLRAKGVEIVPITHATGLSDAGEVAINARLPFDEISRISVEAQASLTQARKENARIIAVGTGVARALESWGWQVNGGKHFLSSLRLSADRPLKVATGLLTGLHEPGASHLDLMGAFLDARVLHAGYVEAQKLGYLWHEYGDACLVI